MVANIKTQVESISPNIMTAFWAIYIDSINKYTCMYVYIYILCGRGGFLPNSWHAIDESSGDQPPRPKKNY